MKKTYEFIYYFFVYYALAKKIFPENQNDLTKLRLERIGCQILIIQEFSSQKELGYLAEEGIDLEIVQPAEDSSATIVGAGGGTFWDFFPTKSG